MSSTDNAMPTPEESAAEWMPDIGKMSTKPTRELLASFCVHRDSQWSAVVADLQAKLAAAEARKPVSEKHIHDWTRHPDPSGNNDVIWTCPCGACTDRTPKEVRDAKATPAPPRPDLSKWPDFEYTGEYRQARAGDWIMQPERDLGPIQTPIDYRDLGDFDDHGRRWILRPRVKPTPPAEADEGLYRVVEDTPNEGWYGIVGPGFDGTFGSEDRVSAERICVELNRVRRVVLAAIRPKAVSVEEAAKVICAGWAQEWERDAVISWEDADESLREHYRSLARSVIRLCGRVPGGRKPELFDLISELEEYRDSLISKKDRDLISEAVEALSKKKDQS